MRNYVKNKARGFTIIEILIVLAIAGLILAIVFVAVPQLQRNARDAKRQDIANRLSSELGTFASNNQGTYPWVGVTGSFNQCIFNSSAAAQSCSDWYSRYICANAACTGADQKVNITDPKSGGLTRIDHGGTSGITWISDRAWITVGGTCQGDKATGGTASVTSKQFALTIALERSGTFYCVDNG